MGWNAKKLPFPARPCEDRGNILSSSPMNTESSAAKFSIGSILSDAWKVFQERFQDIAVAALIIAVPLNVILAFLPKQDPEAGAIDFYVTGAALLVGLIAALASTIAVLGTMRIAEKALNGEYITWDTALRYGLSRWFASFWTSLLAGIMLIGLFLLLIVPGVIFAVYWGFAMAVVALRGMEGMSALRYSRSLVKGRWWKTFGYWLVFGLLNMVCALIVSAVFAVIPEARVSTILGNSVVSLVSAFFTVVGIVFFLRFEATRIEDGAAPVEAE